MKYAYTIVNGVAAERRAVDAAPDPVAWCAQNILGDWALSNELTPLGYSYDSTTKTFIAAAVDLLAPNGTLG